MNKKIRIILSLAVIALTIGLFTYYLSRHKYLLTTLFHISPITVVWILILNFSILIALTFILQACLRICRTSIKYQENLLLNAYSLFINFFIPGQGGPAIRGIYLYKRHRLKVTSYIFVTLLYYVCYGVISVFFLMAGSRAWYETVLAVIGAGIACFTILWFYSRHSKIKKTAFNLSISTVGYLFLVTFIQVLLQLVIYFIELRSIHAQFAFRQIITYTGAANLALFVSITPGAIGIRESFLLFSERLHHISSANIVAASVIDRSVYLIFLGLLFIFTLSLHAKERLTVKTNSDDSPKEN